MRTNHQLATPADHGRHDDAIETQALLAHGFDDDAPRRLDFRLAVDTESNQAELRFVGRVARAALDGNRAAECAPRRHAFTRGMANAVRDDAKTRLCDDGKARGLVKHNRLLGTIVRLPRMMAAARPGCPGPFHQLVMRRELVECSDRLVF
jgi:hypothetical protein